MPINIELLANEPIIIATFEGDITVDDVIFSFTETDRLINEHNLPTPVYRISDYGNINTSFSNVINAVKAAVRRDIPGSVADERINGMLVGRNTWTRMGRDLLAIRGKKQMKLFYSVDSALQHIRAEIKQQSAAS